MNVNKALTLAFDGMPDLTVDPTTTFPSSKAVPIRGISGAAIVCGQIVAKDANGLIRPADANDPSPGGPLATPIGIATCSAPGPNQTIMYVESDGHFTIGGATTPVPGHPYFCSANPGGICTAADLIAGMKTSLVGFGKLPGPAPDTTNFIVEIVASGQTN